mgnify:FL=1
MVKFYKIGTLEKYDPYITAESAGEYINGTFGTYVGTKFTEGEGFYVLMDVEKGDTAGTPDYKVKTGAQVRIANLAKLNGKELKITPDNLTATFAKGNKLVADTTGKLKVNGSAVVPYLEVVDVINFDGTGAKVKIVTV